MLSQLIDVLTIICVWLAFMGFAMSLLTWNSSGMFWYGVGLIVSGVIAKVVLDAR